MSRLSVSSTATFNVLGKLTKLYIVVKPVIATGIDIAKNVFQLHGTNQTGKMILRKKLKEDTLTVFNNKRENNSASDL